MTNESNTKQDLKIGLDLVRKGLVAEAIPFLERAQSDHELRFASPILAVARAYLSGLESVTVSLCGKSFQFGMATGNLGLELHHIQGKFFEPDELEYCFNVVPRRANIVDVGANTGNHLIFFVGALNPNLVIPVEPVPEAVSWLRRNLRLNNMTVDERGLGLAAGRQNGEVNIELDTGQDLVIATTKEYDPESRLPTVKSVRLDDLIPERIDFIKLDVEGFEENVLRGATRILREDKPLMMMEVHEARKDAMDKLLNEFGYKVMKTFPAIGYHNVFCCVA